MKTIVDDTNALTFLGLYPTFKEWKHGLSIWTSMTVWGVYILPLRNENVLITIYSSNGESVYILPLRNENVIAAISRKSAI